MPLLVALPLRSSPRRSRVSFIATGVMAAVLLAAAAASAAFLWSPVQALSAPFVPNEASGHLTEAVSLDDEQFAAIAKLDPALRETMRQATDAAAADGVAIEVTSGWRSRDYQQWLFDDAIETHGSEEAARRFVATADRSRHVTGEAVDIGPVDAQLWLIEHGARWGLCQIYANERWHFEVATEPGGVCPSLLPDAAG